MKTKRIIPKVPKEDRLNFDRLCDCFIGELSGDKVTKSTLENEVGEIVRMQPQFQKYGLLKGEPQTKKQIVDGRSGYLHRFIYCPYCGEKISWKKIINW